MLKRMILAWAILLAPASGAVAQDEAFWIQIEARPSLGEATERARAYAAELPDVNGFSLGGGWYGIALGPYARADARRALGAYLSEGVIPSDSYIALGSDFRQQFWPIGANVLNSDLIGAPAPAAPLAPGAALEAPEPAVAEPGPGPEPAVAAPGPEPAVAEPEPAPAVAAPAVEAPDPGDETPAEALRGERRLTRAERDDLQVALRWEGAYADAIDGAFGRGTRDAMARWQERKGFDATGILTTRQRALLLRDYDSALDGLGLALVHDDLAGIEMMMPTGVVAFEKYEYPFAHYTASGDVAATVLLISQEGDEATLSALYDVMQTLDIVPPDGPRALQDRSFVLVGEDAARVSETRVALEDGQVKGFTVVWPAGDEERRARLVDEMERSFARTGGVIPADANTPEQGIDLLSGLQLRKPRLSRSGFFVDRRGTVLTTMEAADGCARVVLDSETEAEVSVLDADRGVAVLRPGAALAPRAVARFANAQPRLQSEVAAAGFSFEGVLGAPSVTFGTLSDVRGLGGEPDIVRLQMDTLPGDAGGPVLDAAGGVLGMLLPEERAGGRVLPDGVRFALDREALRDVLSGAGLAAAGTSDADPIHPVDLARAATGMTVLVSCWD